MPKLLNYSELVQESADELLQQEKAQSKSYLRDRVQFLRLLKTGVAKSQAQAGELIGLRSRQSQNLWKLYQQEGLAGVLRPKPGNHWGRLSSTELSYLLQRLDQDDIKTQKEIRAFLQAEMGQEYTQPGIHYLCKRLRVKLKTGRPSNVRKDEVGAVVFKKTLPS
ncbi:MAG: hypothetical protein AAF992_25420 [Bacteroidota bacterium]